ncbi:hypothetical protein N7G274_004567 [Stereocaulon virgatum]|uniref:Uncharacterized protein n=1 Tax=Stereocaulon virgatum TaxID=373712 RepID=A0ABR4AAP0_9LECA
MEASIATSKASAPTGDRESSQECEYASEDRARRLMDLLQTQNRTNYRQILPKPTDIEIEQCRLEEMERVEEQSRVEEKKWMEHQKWVEYQEQIKYQEWAEYQQRVQDQKRQTLQNTAALEARNIMQLNHLQDFPALSSWDACHRYAATNAARQEASGIVQPGHESSPNHATWNADQNHNAVLTDADFMQPASGSMDGQAEDQGYHVADNLASLDGIDVSRSYSHGRACYPSPPTGDPVHDTYTSPYFGDALLRASRSEDFTTMEELLEYE